MARKVYGVKGLMEWNAIIRVGKAAFHIPFKGGSMTTYGVVPAQYITSDDVTQHIIENSNYFKSGKIYIVRVYESEGGKVAKDAACKTHKVSSIEDARDYLADNFGATKSELRSRKAIEECALSKGIKLEGF